MKTYFNADVRNFLSKLTVARIANILQVVGSFFVSKWTGKAVQWGVPMTVSFEPTTHCNLRCPECPSGLRAFTRPTGMLKEDFFRQTVDEIAHRLLYLYFYFQGEPYLNPDFLEMVRYASQRGIYTVTSTNAHFLTDKNAQKTVEVGLDRIIIAIDGTTQSTYESYRVGGKLEKVLEGTRRLVHWKRELKSSTPHIIFQFLVVRPNEHQISEVYQLAKELGVDEVKLKTAQIYDYENGNPLIPTIDQFSRYRRNTNGTYSIKNQLLNHCWKLWHSCVITWDGKVVPCCFDKDATHQLGDLRQNSFQNIWQNAAYRQFRTAILQSRSKIDICANCSEGTKVWA